MDCTEIGAFVDGSQTVWRVQVLCKDSEFRFAYCATSGELEVLVSGLSWVGAEFVVDAFERSA